MSVTAADSALVAAERARFRNSDRGRYEVYYLTAALGPGRAVWLRWTLLAPVDGEATCSVWGVVFDGLRAGRFAHRATSPGSAWRPREGGGVEIGGSALTPSGASGSLVDEGGHTLRWDLSWQPVAEPFPFFPPQMERAAASATFPIAAVPLARASGVIELDGERIAVDGAPLEQSHLFGGRHANRWAWMHAAGFDGDPDSFLLLIWARPQRLGGHVPAASSLSLRLDGELHRSGQLRGVHWSDLGGDAARFRARAGRARVSGTVIADVARFCGVTYHDPEGGAVYCANTGIADLRLSVELDGRTIERVATSTCAFERGARTPFTDVWSPL